MEMKIQNALIERVSLSTADHGILSGWLHLDYGGTSQGFGGLALYTPSKWTESQNCAGHWLWRVMEIAGVTEWSSLKGRTIRVESDHSKVHAIGHIIKDDWFRPSDDFAD